MELEGYNNFELVGSGGNAHVYRALTDGSSDEVAVKVLRGAGDEAVTRRFERERKLMQKLEDIDGVVPILDSGVTSGDLFLVMPLFTGGSLQSRLSDAPIHWELALELIRQVAQAVADAHALRILHLDIKPANVLLDDQGHPWLGDFGIAEMMGSTASMSAAMMTPAYTPPERLRNEKPTELTDIYSLGATLFALLAGGPPFGAEDNMNPASVMMAVLNETVPLSRLPHEVPDAVKNLVLQCMSKNPEDRPGSAEQIVSLIEVASEGGEISAPPTIDPREDPPTVPAGGSVGNPTVARDVNATIGSSSGHTVAGMSPAPEASGEGRGKKGLVLTVAAVLFVVLVGFGVAFAFGGRDGDDSTEVASVEAVPEAESEVLEASVVSGVDESEVVVEPSPSADSGSVSEQSSVDDVASPEAAAPAPTVAQNTQAAAPAPTVAQNTQAPARPDASFTTSSSSIEEGDSVSFRDTSSGEVSSVRWSFGDGGSSSGSSVSHTFRSEGSYTVTLTVSGPGGTDSASRTIGVRAKPAALPPRPDNIGCSFFDDGVNVQWAFSPLPARVDTYVLEFSNGSRQDIGRQPGPFTTTDNNLRRIIAVKSGAENATSVGSCTQHGGTKPTVSSPALPGGVSCRFHDFFFNAAGIYTWSETWNWSGGANTDFYIMRINQDGSFIEVNNGGSTTHTTVGVNGQSNSGRSVKGIIAANNGGLRTELSIANCGAMGGTGWVPPN